MKDILKALRDQHGFNEAEMEEHKKTCMMCAVMHAIEEVKRAVPEGEEPYSFSQVQKILFSALIFYAAQEARGNKVAFSNMRGELFMYLAENIARQEVQLELKDAIERMAAKANYTTANVN